MFSSVCIGDELYNYGSDILAVTMNSFGIAITIACHLIGMPFYWHNESKTLKISKILKLNVILFIVIFRIFDVLYLILIFDRLEEKSFYEILQNIANVITLFSIMVAGTILVSKQKKLLVLLNLTVEMTRKWNKNYESTLLWSHYLYAIFNFSSLFTVFFSNALAYVSNGISMIVMHCTSFWTYHDDYVFIFHSLLLWIIFMSFWNYFGEYDTKQLQYQNKAGHQIYFEEY